MKKLLTLLILTSTLTYAAVLNIHDGIPRTEIPNRWTSPDGARWTAYHTVTELHYEHGWRTLSEMPTCPEGYEVANFSWVEVGGVAVASWDCEEIVPPDLLAPPDSLMARADVFRDVLRGLFGPGAETNRAVTVDSVELVVLSMFKDPELAQQAVVFERILDRGYTAITEFTGTTEVWTFFETYGHLLDPQEEEEEEEEEEEIEQ